MTRAIAISSAPQQVIAPTQYSYSRGSAAPASRLVVFPPRYTEIVDLADLADESETSATQSIDLAFVWSVGHNLSLAKPFSIQVEQLDDCNFVARFPEANINASGSTFTEAIQNWKDVLAFKFDHYSSFPSDKLGSGPKAHLAAMRRYITRT